MNQKNMDQKDVFNLSQSSGEDQKYFEFFIEDKFARNTANIEKKEINSRKNIF